MTKALNIGKNTIGNGNPAFIIAEAGVNHNGSLDMALELVRAVKKTGADCIKFQTFKASAVVTKEAPKADYQLEVTDRAESQLEMLKKLELQRSDYDAIIQCCGEEEVMFLSTPYNFDDADFLNELGVGAFKIASGQLVEHAFLQYVAGFGKPLIISTGMATMEEVEEAVSVIKSTGNEQLVVLQCTTNYPSLLEDSNVRAMNTMGEQLDVLVGYSDHVENDYACLASVALGATVIEKHFTLDRSLPGPDHSSSLEPDGFKNLVDGIRSIEKSLGDGKKKPTAAEVANTRGMRRSIVALSDIPAGTTFSKELLGFKRPADGIAPKRWNEIIGKKAAKDIAADQQLSEDQVIW